MKTPSNVTEIRPGAQAALAAESEKPTVDKLCETIELLDNFSQRGFSQIDAIAALVLASLETPAPSYAVHIERVADAMNAIRYIAGDIKGCINFEAEEAGCNYIRPDTERRRAARAGRVES